MMVKLETPLFLQQLKNVSLSLTATASFIFSGGGGHFSDFSAKIPYFFLDIALRHQLLLGIDIKVDPRLPYNI